MKKSKSKDRSIEDMLKNKPDGGSRYRPDDGATKQESDKSKTDRLMRMFEENLWQWQRLEKGPDNIPAHMIVFDHSPFVDRRAWIHDNGRITFSSFRNFAPYELAEIMAKHETLFFQENTEQNKKRQKSKTNLDKNALKLVCDGLERLACDAEKEDWGYKDAEPEKAKAYRQAAKLLKDFKND